MADESSTPSYAPPADDSPATAAKPGARRSEIVACAALCLGLFGLYASAIDIGAANLYVYNFIFDADPQRVTMDAEHGQHGQTYERHPLFLSVFTIVTDGIMLLGISRQESVRLLVSAYSALGVFFSFFVFRRVCTDPRDAFFFTSLHGVAAARWLFGAIPSTFGVNAMFVAVALLFHDPRFAQPRRRPVRFAVNALVSALALGFTTPLAVYVLLSQMSAVRRAHASMRARVLSVLAYVAATACCFLAVVWLQGLLLPGRMHHDSGYTHPLSALGQRDALLDFFRPFVLGEVAAELRAFTIDSLIAPQLAVEVVESVEGPMQMIQYGSWSTPGYLVTLAVFAAFALSLLRWPALSSSVRSHDAQLAAAFLLFNLALHYAYRSNGQLVIFTTQTVLPLLLLIAHLYAASRWRPRRVLLPTLALATAVNSALMIRDLDRILHLECADRAHYVCARWKGDEVEARFEVGLRAYRESVFFWLDRGNDALQARDGAAALGFLREAEARHPESHLVQRSLAIAMLQLNRRDDALTHLRRAVEMEPSDVVARSLLRRLGEAPTR